MVSYIKEGMQAKGIWKQDPEANIWDQEGCKCKWRRLLNDELHSLYRSRNIVRAIKPRRLRWAGHVARMEEGTSALIILTGKPTGKRPLGRPRRRWEDNIWMDLKEIDINTRNWVDSAQNRDYCGPLWMRHWTSGFHKPCSYLIYVGYKKNKVNLFSKKYFFIHQYLYCPIQSNSP